MKVIQERLECRKCETGFDHEVVVDAPVEVFTASLRAVYCPNCGADCKHIGLGGALPGLRPVAASVEDRAEWWFRNGDTGTSSLTIWHVFTGRPSPHRDFCWPWDPDDFRRCRILLNLIPEWREELCRVGVVFPWFEPFARRWDEFERLYVEEVPDDKGSAPKLYHAMRVAVKEAQKIRYAQSANAPDPAPEDSAEESAEQ